MRTIVTLALAAGAALGGGLLAQSRATGAPPPATPVAVVDVLQVVSAHPRKNQLEEKNRATKDGIETYLQAAEKRIKDLEGTLRLKIAADPERPALAKQIAHDLAEYKFEKEWRLREAQDTYFAELSSIYDEVRAEIRNVAMAMGFSVVLNRTEDKFDVSSGNEFYLNVGMRSVLYYEKAVDLTAAVRDRVAARGGMPPGTPPVAPPPPPPAPPGMAGGALPPPAMGGALPPPAMGGKARRMARNQRSVAKEGVLRGAGLHTGADVEMRVRPAPPDTGVQFVRTDLPGAPRIPADAAHLGTRERRTALVGERGAEVHTVEHFLACCAGLRIDNLVVEISGPEVPGVDGSGGPFADLLRSLSPTEQRALRREIVVEEPLAVSGGEDVSVSAFPFDGGMKVSYTLDYGRPYPGVQHLSLVVTEDAFAREIAPARTFCLESEAEELRRAGLGKGASYENTLVIGEKGVVGNQPRWPDEFARHKVLDLLGDLFLAGADLRGHVFAHRAGHAANLRFVARVVEAGRQRETEGRVRRHSGLDAVQIRRILPHRYPFLMVDRVIEIDGFRRAVGVKNVTVNEPFFQGHYPDQPIMPGVMVVEAMAQLGGILLLRKLELTGRLPVLLSIDRVKFRRAVVPGDQVRLEAETVRLSSGRGRIQCRATVQGALVAQARLNFALTEEPS